jgi:leader peptidase (prepilin peptidase)/N-methyltransferase
LSIIDGQFKGLFVTPQEWIILAFVFAFGCCIGSFLNVVIYRFPRGKSLVHPGSACPKCGRPIRFYDNIPLVSWLLLRAKCRYCRNPISPRYFVVELLTGSVFVGLYWVYFHSSFHTSTLVSGGVFVYVLHVILLAALIAGSGIDLEFWIIPLSICWFVTAVGLIGSAVGGYLIDPAYVRSLLPVATPATGALALGGAIGLGISLTLMKTGILKRSYEQAETDAAVVQERQATKPDAADPHFNHRVESLREIVFLAPIILCSILAYRIIGSDGGARWWSDLIQQPAAGGFFGSLFGYFVGCGIIWAIRILGTLGFGKEAMGLGDVHLLGAAGAVIGPWMVVVVAIFVAPFSGLAWAVVQMFSKKTHEIPYGPHLSVGVLCVMISHDWILTRFAHLLSP